MLRHDAQNRMVFSDPLWLLPGEGPGPASSEQPFCKSRATAEVPVDTPFTHQALVLPEAPAGWLNHRAAGVRASFRYGSRRVFLKGTFSKWLVPQLLGHNWPIQQHLESRSGEVHAAETPQWEGTQPSSDSRRKEAVAACDGDFLCAQGPKCQVWVNLKVQSEPTP